MKIYCKNKGCQNFKFLEECINFQFRKYHYKSFDNMCNGECKISPLFDGYDEVAGFIRYEGAECLETEDAKFCNRIDCLHNSNYNCSRDEILVDEINNKWVCRCFSKIKVRGHMDWSRFPIGGSIDDVYANKLHYEKQKTKSYRDGIH